MDSLHSLRSQWDVVIRGFRVACSITALLACSSCATDVQKETSAGGSTETPLSPMELTEVSHLSEGSEVFPLFLARVLRARDSSGGLVPILSDRFFTQAGAILDPDSPTKMPMGFTTGIMPDLGIRGIGLNCVACHAARLSYTNTSNEQKDLLVMGGGGMLSTEIAIGGLFQALRAELQTGAPVEPLESFLARVQEEAAREPEGVETAMRAFRIFTAILAAAESPQGAVGGARALAERLAPEATARERGLIAARYHWFRASFTTRKGSVPSGFARSPSLALTRNRYLYDIADGPVPLNGPVRVPSIFHIEHQFWNHNGLINSVLDRNIDQALSTGGIFDWKDTSPTLETSVQVTNLHKLERLVARFNSPTWPTDAAYDVLRAERGRVIYQEKCASCHAPESAEHDLYNARLFSVDEMGTDVTNLLAFAPLPESSPVRNVAEFAQLRVRDLRENYYATHTVDGERVSGGQKPIDKESQAQWEDLQRRGPSVFRSPAQGAGAKVLAARSLGGIWATAPYLRNGSVPTIMDLLTDEAKRPSAFFTGQRAYDMDRLGIKLVIQPDPSINAIFKFDTTTIGNSNKGHSGDRFGTTLSEADKLSLIEYLKNKTSFLD